jgi:uroporphyrinogen decarboxylase
MDFQPAIYEHAARLINRRPWDVSRSVDLLFEAHAAAYEAYRHSPVVVGIDIYNLEAEAHGCLLAEPQGNEVPAIFKRPFKSVKDLMLLPILDPDGDGRLPIVIDAAKRLKAKYPRADVRIPVSGPFSLACNLVGFESVLCELVENPDLVGLVLDQIVSSQTALCRSIAANGLSVSLFDSGATPPLVSPRLFEEVVLPALDRMIKGASFATGQLLPCIIGGNTEPIADLIMKTKPGYVICPSETDQIAFMRKMDRYPNTMVRVNMNAGVFATNDMDKITHEANRAFDIARIRANSCIGSGALPYEADPQIVQDTAEYIMVRAILLI